MLTKLKVLAVEDDRIIRRLIRVNLEADGLHVCEADTHLDCLNVVKQQDCGLLLLSREISEEEALQVVGQVREAEGWAMPVLLVTVDVPSKSFISALEPAAFIRKPFDAAMLARSVRHLLGGTKPTGLALEGEQPVC